MRIKFEKEYTKFNELKQYEAIMYKVDKTNHSKWQTGKKLLPQSNHLCVVAKRYSNNNNNVNIHTHTHTNTKNESEIGICFCLHYNPQAHNHTNKVVNGKNTRMESVHILPMIFVLLLHWVLCHEDGPRFFVCCQMLYMANVTDGNQKL